MIVSAKYLRPGDVLVFTNRTVLWVGNTLLTPPGKIGVLVKAANGRRLSYHWWIGTQLEVRRKAEGSEVI